MWEFVKSITAPVAHDGREHIEYVPTQILTEYFRGRVKGEGASRLDGIVYPAQTATWTINRDLRVSRRSRSEQDVAR